MGSGVLGSLTRHVDQSARWCAVAIGFSLPISVAADSILLVLVVLGFALGGAYRHKWRILRDNPIALSALALYAMLLIGSLYGNAAPGDRESYLVKYSDLLAIPLLLYFFREPAVRRYGIGAFAASLVLILLWSTLFKAGVIPKLPFTRGDDVFPVVFKLKLTHNVLMAFAGFLFTCLAIGAGTKALRLMWTALAVLAIINVMLLIPGATGYLITAALALYLAYGWARWRGITVAVFSVTLLFAVLTIVPGAFQERMLQMSREVSALTGGPAPHDSSLGLRLNYYRLTLAIIRDHPLTGVGTGGFPKAYREKAQKAGPVEVRNPHNEYLLMTAQNGVIGLLLLLHLFWRHWRLAPQLATPLETRLARGLLLTIMLGCLFNSFLLDHTEGLLYAWMTGLLFAGYNSPVTRRLSN